MTKRWMRNLGFVLALGVGSLSVEAQRVRRPADPPRPPPSCDCSAGGADCLFGNAAGCNVQCTTGGCECAGAWCFFGFPRASKCTCTGGIEV